MDNLDKNPGSTQKKISKVVSISNQKLYKAVNPNISSSKTTDGVSIEYWNSSDSLDDNAFPQYLIDCLNFKSAIFQNCISLKRSLCYGSGLQPTDENNQAVKELLKRRNKAGDTLDQIFFKVCQDFPLFEQAGLQVFYDRSGKIEDVYYTDISKIRAETPDQVGLIRNFYLSNYWGHISNKRSNGKNIKYNDLKDAIKIPAYNPKSFEEGKQFLFIKKSGSGNGVYAVPSFSSALKAIDTDWEISRYFLNKMQNGLLASQMITFFADLSEEQQDEVTQNFKNKYAGANGSPILLNFASSDTNKPEIVGLEGNIKDTLFTTMKGLVQQEVAYGNGLHLGLLGIDATSSLNSDSAKINTSRLLFINSVIIPFQNIILEAFNRILEHNGYGENAVTVYNAALPLTLPELQPNDTTRSERRKLLLDLEELEEDKKQVIPTTPTNEPNSSSSELNKTEIKFIKN